ncbi:MAG: multidrug effflux MFS transporter [Nocardioides sp.]|uniref:multidrug effflux MFS transporter n=1 Tax=Nocardioides sp. TaxID=35761 RepID=UPI003F0539C1
MSRPIDLNSRRAMVGIPIALAMLSMIGPFSIDTPFPAFAQMRAEFGASTQQMQLVVTTYLLAFAAMSLFHGPISDAVGRRPVIVVSVSLYVLACIGAAFSPNLAVLLVFRVLQGLFAGGATIVSRTIIRDLYEGDQAQRLMSRVAMIFGLAPAIAPVVGGLVLQVGPWPVVFWLMAGLGVALIVTTVLVIPESHPRERRTPLAVGQVVSGLGAVARNPAFARVAPAASFAFGAQFLYIGGASIFVVDVLGLGELDFWVFFAPMIGGMVIGSWISGRAAGRISGRRLVSLGFTVALAGGVVGVPLAVGAPEGVLPWAMVGPTLVALGNGMLYPTLNLMMLDLFPERRGAAVSGGSFLTLVLNATVASLVTPVVGESALGFAVTAVSMVVLGLLFWSWHLAIETRDTAVPRRPEELEPTDLM